ncbi:tetraacyldisaccharide 4'-kinase [Candidatus Nitrospira allomarina]|uniref:Tetraacyldisaccharide 4'-kinase n=1 Tax=Candidatus Nitrospira allomarina TaxID=3020900 RepID=A0AA96GFK0_9BACT|nr:tetraacyldisaccharide 4'-kinase [Candidatus Nitrospira allomarina]WNM56861.1 tetraacyldisaccharide 4'-kinase [Candidatus Nitrospira allomarina]
MNTTSPSLGVNPERLWRWLDRRCPWILRGCAVPYGAVGHLRRTAYQRGWFPQHRLPKPVISVGNMTVGGTGKTPLVMWLAARLHERGKRVAILSRGYGRERSVENRLVSDGVSLKGDWRSVGDEAMLMARKCPWAIVAVGTDRYRLGQWVLEQASCDCFLLDDGFQHLSLYRDLDVLVFDATDVEGLRGVVPAGRMREPLSAAKWATTFVFSRTEQVTSVASLQNRIEQSLGMPIVPIRLETKPGMFTHIATGKSQPAGAFKGTACLLFSGIGNPASFRSSVVSCGLTVDEEIRYPDHFSYSEKDVEAIRLKMRRVGLALVITTEKDAVKIKQHLKCDDPLWALDGQVRIAQGEDRLREQLHTICP